MEQAFPKAGSKLASAPLVPGEWHTLHRVDLAEIQVKGSAGDTVTINGGTW